MGLPKGYRHSGQFKSVDERRWTNGPRNPNGRKQAYEDLVKDKTLDCVKTLMSIVEDPEQSARDRIQACEYVINSAMGKPVDRVMLANMDGTQDKTGAIGRMLALLDEGAPPIGLNSDDDVVSSPTSEILEISEPDVNTIDNEVIDVDEQ